MELGNVVTAVSSAPEAAVAPPVSAQAPQPESRVVDTSSISAPLTTQTKPEPPQDAVQLELSSNPAPEATAEREPESSEAVGMSREQAERIAKRFEASLNSTEVKFQVSLLEDNGSGQLNFQVLDKETGRVIRQFPPDKIMVVEQKAAFRISGKLIDDAV